MFRTHPSEPSKDYRGAIVGLLILSALALLITVWIMVDLTREQGVVQRLTGDLPPRERPAAEMLAGELRWQFRLSTLVLINLVATGIAIVLLWRAYQTSQVSLRDFKALAGDVLSSMDQAVITTDLQGHVTSFNRRATELLGFQHDPIDQPIELLTDQIDLANLGRFESILPDELPPETQINRDFDLQSRDGRRWLRLFSQRLKDTGDAVIGHVVQVRDVTAEVHLEQQMRRMERFMGLGSVAVGLHHEIKNPLAALSLHVQLLEEQLQTEGHTDNADEACEMISIVKSEVERIANVLEGFRDFASFGQLNRQRVDLISLIQNQIRFIRPRADQSCVAIRFKTNSDLTDHSNFYVWIDRVRIEQVHLNLMLNSLEAMPDGGTLTLRCENVELAGTKAVRITVADTGGGIPENVRDHIFDPYFTTKSQGTGMGLALSDKIVRQHNGELTFITSASGTTFQIILPIDGDDDAG